MSNARIVSRRPSAKCFTCFFFLLASTAHSNQFGPDSVNVLTTEKREYLEGEPIGLLVTVTNPGREVVRLDDDHVPELFLNADLSFRLEGTRLSAISNAAGGSFLGPGKFVVPPGGRWQARVYLQRYVQPLRQGRYRLPYSWDLSGIRGQGDFPNIILKARGVIEFTVLPPDPRRLRAILEEYVRPLEHTEWLDEEGVRRTLSAIEALSHVTDPIVVPLLAKVALGMEGHYVMELLRYFRHVPEARAIVLNALNSDPEDSRVLDRALVTLADWKVPVPPETLEKLRKSQDESIQAYLRDYLDFVTGKTELTAPSKVMPRVPVSYRPELLNDVRPPPGSPHFIPSEHE